jgi:hypothetical protein
MVAAAGLSAPDASAAGPRADVTDGDVVNANARHSERDGWLERAMCWCGLECMGASSAGPRVDVMYDDEHA